VFLGVYNYARFGSVTEFGMHYTLQGFQSAQAYTFYSLHRVPAGLFYYLLAPPRITSAFPFFHLDPAYYLSPPPGYYLEPIAGVLVHTPLLLILPLTPFVMRHQARPEAGVRLVVGGLLTTGLLFVALFSLTAGTMRYEVDFATFLLIPGLLCWASLISRTRGSSGGRAVATSVFVAFVVATVVCNAAFSITGYYDNLKAGSPATYDAIHDVFRPLELWLSSDRR
jgi:hypothetical protein